jgi:hypothetical protein
LARIWDCPAALLSIVGCSQVKLNPILNGVYDLVAW